MNAKCFTCDKPGHFWKQCWMPPLTQNMALILLTTVSQEYVLNFVKADIGQKIENLSLIMRANPCFRETPSRTNSKLPTIGFVDANICSTCACRRATDFKPTAIGSAAWGIDTSQGFTVTPFQCSYTIPSGIFRPIRKDTVGLVIGHSSLSVKNNTYIYIYIFINAYLWAIDSNYKTEI